MDRNRNSFIERRRSFRIFRKLSFWGCGFEPHTGQHFFFLFFLPQIMAKNWIEICLWYLHMCLNFTEFVFEPALKAFIMHFSRFSNLSNQSNFMPKVIAYDPKVYWIFWEPSHKGLKNSPQNDQKRAFFKIFKPFKSVQPYA